MNFSEHAQQLKEGTHKWTRILEVLGAILLVAFLGWMIYSYVSDKNGEEEKGNDVVAADLTQVTREALIEAMSQQVENPPTVSEKERERLFKEMSQQAPVSAGDGATTEVDTPATKTPTAEERAKMMEMMSQQSP